MAKIPKRFSRQATPFRLAAHQFHKTFREPPPDTSWYKLFEQMTEQRLAREKQFGRLYGAGLLIFAALAASGPTPTLQMQGAFFSVNLPRIYIAFVGSAFVAMSIFEALSAFLIVECQRRTLNRFRKNYPNATVFAAPLYSGGLWTVMFTMQFSGILQPTRLKVAQNVGVALIVFPVLLIYMGEYWLVLSIAWNAIASDAGVFMGRFFGVAAVVILLAPACLFVLAFVPVKLRKNVFAIRWGFLYRIYKRDGFTPDHVKGWLEDAR